MWQFNAAPVLAEVFGMIIKRPLSASVLGIVFGGANEQMIRVNARWIIPTWAIMAKKHAGRDQPTEEFPGPTMGIHSASHGDNSISCLGLGFFPKPASIWGQVHALHKCCDRVWKLLGEELSVFFGDKHRPLCDVLESGQLGEVS